MHLSSPVSGLCWISPPASHPAIHTSYSGVWVSWNLPQLSKGDRSPIYRRANRKKYQYVFGLGGKFTWRKPIPAWGEHVNFTQKGPAKPTDVNTGSFCREAAMLNIAPLCCLQDKYICFHRAQPPTADVTKHSCPVYLSLCSINNALFTVLYSH